MYFHYICYYLLTVKRVVVYLNKPQYPFTVFCYVWLKLARWLWRGIVPLENSPYGNVTITTEELQSLNNSWYSWPLSSGSSLLWDRTSSPSTRDTHTCCRTFGSGAVSTCFNDLRLPWLGFENSTFRMRGEHFNRLRHRCGLWRSV